MNVHPKAGALLKSARERAGLTQRQLADAMGTGQARVSRVEADDEAASPAWLALAARSLGVPPASVGLDDVASLRDDVASSLPPLDPSGLVITLTIDYAEGRDDACLLVAATDADAEAMARLGVGRRVEARSIEFGCLLTLAANRRVDVLLRYDRRRRPLVLKDAAKAKAKGKPAR